MNIMFNFLLAGPLTAFIGSALGRHNAKSFGADIGLNKVSKIAKQNVGGLTSEGHSSFHEILSQAEKVMTGSGMKIGQNIMIKGIECGINHLVDSIHAKDMLSYSNDISKIGTQNSFYVKTQAHVGNPTTEKLKNLLNTPNVQYNQKDLTNTDKDYIQHDKKKQLTLKCGFNEKCFSFFMEDTFLTTDQLIQFFRSDPKIENNLRAQKNGIHNVYAAVYKTMNQFKFTNILEYHNVVLKLHLVKIVDIHDDPRNLITEFTNNNSLSKIISTDEITEETSNATNSTSILETRLRKSKISQQVEEAVKKSNLPVNAKKRLQDILRENTTNCRGFEFGRLPEDQQYSDPNLNDKNNRFSISFNCSLNTRLTDSIQFKDRAKIVQTWYKVLSPDSTWEFNLDHHLGKGIHLNYLLDIENLNKSAPAGFIFVLEQFGDRRAKITRRQDFDLFTGYSPTRVLCDFKNQLGYLGQDAPNFGNDIPVFYREKRNNLDFEEKSDFNDLFSPEREDTFHVQYDDIQFLTSSSNKKIESKDAKAKQKLLPYILNYDQTVLPNNNLMDKIHFDFQKYGLDINNLTEEDARINLTNPPSEDENRTQTPLQDTFKN